MKTRTHPPSVIVGIIFNCCYTAMKAHLCGIKAKWRTSCGCELHEAFQIDVQELEDQVEPLVGMDDVEKPGEASKIGGWIR